MKDNFHFITAREATEQSQLAIDFSCYLFRNYGEIKSCAEMGSFRTYRNIQLPDDPEQITAIKKHLEEYGYRILTSPSTAYSLEYQYISWEHQLMTKFSIGQTVQFRSGFIRQEQPNSVHPVLLPDPTAGKTGTIKHLTETKAIVEVDGNESEVYIFKLKAI